jgi:hypothetical protein
MKSKSTYIIRWIPSRSLAVVPPRFAERGSAIIRVRHVEAYAVDVDLFRTPGGLEGVQVRNLEWGRFAGSS